MIRYYVAAFAAWALASFVLYLFGAFVAASFNLMVWHGPGRFFVGLGSLVIAAFFGVWAYGKSEDIHNLTRLDIAGREASVRWHRDWIRRSEIER